MPLINCKVEINKQSIVFWRELEQIMLMVMLIIILILLLSKVQNYMFLLQLYQRKRIKNYQSFLAKDLKDKFNGMNIKQKEMIKI